MTTHVCHAHNCEIPVPRKMFMCKRHWRMVPKVDRDLIWSLYTPGQETLRVRPSDSYLNEAVRIVNELAERETADRVPVFGDRIMVRSFRPSGWVPARVSAMQGEPGRHYGWVATDGLMVPLDLVGWRWPEPGEWSDDAD